MQPVKKKLSLPAALALLAGGCLLALLAAAGLAFGAARAFDALMTRHTLSSLEWARRQGVYPTPQQGVIARAYQNYCDVERVEIEHASTNSFDGSDPHVWFVIYRVYARSHKPCDPPGAGPTLHHGLAYEGGGVFFLNIKDGWVMMPEGRFPVLIGRWMKKLDLAGPGDPYHIPRD